MPPRQGFLWTLFLILSGFLSLASAQNLDTFWVKDFDLSLKVQDAKAGTWSLEIQAPTNLPAQGYAAFRFKGGETEYLRFEQHRAQRPYLPSYEGELLKIQSLKGRDKATKLWHIRRETQTELRIQPLALTWSLAPPLVAIFLALLTRQVLLSLFLGVFVGAWLSSGMPLDPYHFSRSIFKVLDYYLLQSLLDSSHLSVVLFSLIIGGVVALISRNGGMAGIVEKIAPYAQGPKSSQFVAWLLGIAIFFDDYANSLIVGNTVRPLTDRYGVSRAKLAYIVDSTAAPISSIAFITTWIGAELGYITDAFSQLEGMNNPPGAYGVFLSSLAYSFYAYLTIVFILMVVFSGRDFGPMLKAETRARSGQVRSEPNHEDETGEAPEDLSPLPNAPLRWVNGLVPVLFIIFGTFYGLMDTGMMACFQALQAKGIVLDSPSWSLIWQALPQLEAPSQDFGTVRKLGLLIGSADSYKALLWASVSALLIAIILTISQRITRFETAVNISVQGFKTMLPALMILVFAWALATTTKELATADFLTTALGDYLSPYSMPVVIFILSAAISFSTGSSWSTMAILYPIAIPMTWTICLNYGLSQEASMEVLYNVIAIVLAASVMGDHCSPISDTTILSSLACDCNHIEHVSTQMPYALVVGTVSIVLAYVSTAWNLGFFFNFALGLAVLALVLRFFGRKPHLESH